VAAEGEDFDDGFGAEGLVAVDATDRVGDVAAAEVTA
jgi:hypothetical protein